MRVAHVLFGWKEILLRKRRAREGLLLLHGVWEALHGRRKAVHGWWMMWKVSVSEVMMVVVMLSHLELGLTMLLVAASSIHPPIPPVLDSIVATASQPPCNLCPSLAHLVDHLFDQDTLFW